MKKILYILFSIMIIGKFSACTDILDTAPYDQLSSGSMWSSESLADQGVSGIYYYLRTPVYNANYAVAGSIAKLGYYAWESFGATGQTRLGMNGVYSASAMPNNAIFSSVWKWSYDGIHQSNDAIANIPKIDMNEDKKARLIAESKALRAFFYMRLNELFGNDGIGVPLYTEPIAPEECTRPQSSEAEIWAQIVNDLTDAINTSSLPNNDIKGDGRVSKGTAYALRGRAYLLSKDYAKAAADFAKVSECGYGLFPDYKGMFKPANDQNEEMIFYVQNIEDATGFGSLIQKFAAPWNAGSQDGRGCWTDVQIAPFVVDLYEVKVDDNTVKSFDWSDYIPQWNNVPVDGRAIFFTRDTKLDDKEIHPTITNAVNNTVLSKLKDELAPLLSLYLPEGNEARIKKAYENRDPRLGLSIIVPYSSFTGVNSNSSAAGEYISRWPVSGKYFFDQASSESSLVPGMKTSLVANGQQYFYYMYRKFIGEGLEYKYREHNPVDEPIIRYADVLLMWAEALVEQNDLSGARDKVKQVRDRVSMPTMTTSFSDQTTARNYVRDERRREFVGEGINFFDEMRWRTLKETKFDYGAKTSMQVWGGVSTGSPTLGWNNYFYTWPVPKAECELNPNLTKTPGWNYN